MKNTFTFVVSIMILAAISCKKADNIPPELLSINLTMNDTIRNSFPIIIEASDNNGVSSIELFANDSLIVTMYKSPFNYQLNTMQLKDGEYIIKAIVRDSEDNKSETSYKVTVQNALLTFRLGSNILNGQKYVISDEQGNVIKSGLLQGTGNIKIMPPAQFENDGINLALLYDKSEFKFINCFVHVKRGSVFKMDWPVLTAPVLEGVKLHMKNDIGPFTKIILSTDRFRYELTSMSDTINLPQSIPYSKGHKLLIQLNIDAGKYYRLVTVDNVAELKLNLSSITSVEIAKTISSPSGGSLGAYILGRANVSDSVNEYYISEAHSDYNVNYVSVNYPSEYFAKYHTGLQYVPYHVTNDYKSYFNQYHGEIPLIFEPLAVDFRLINSNPSNFSADISGKFDFYYVMYYDHSLNIELAVSVPVNQKEWKFPDLSSVFNNTDYKFDNFVWSQIQFVNEKSLDWTNKYFDVELNFEKLNWLEDYTQYMYMHNSQSPVKREIHFREFNRQSSFVANFVINSFRKT